MTERAVPADSIAQYVEDSAVAASCLDETAKRVLAVSPTGPLSAGLLAFIAHGRVPSHRLALWLVIVVLATVTNMVVFGVHLRRRRSGRVTGRQLPVHVLSSLCWGLAWSAAPVLVNPGLAGRDLQAIVLMFLAGCGAITVVLYAGNPVLFLCFQIPLCLSAAGVQFAQGDRISVLLGGSCVLFLGVTLRLNNLTRRWWVGAVRMQFRNEWLVLELRSLNEVLARQAAHDPLTNLPNRAPFFDHLSVAAAQARRHGTSYGVLYIDIDGFKAVNDTLGHGAGDELLVQVAARMRATLRESDLLARMAGDEFTVLISPPEDEAGARGAAERVREDIARPFLIDGVTVSVSCSVGVAVGRGVDSPDDVLGRADRALYQAKRAGRDRVVLADATVRADDGDRGGSDVLLSAGRARPPADRAPR